MAKFTNFYRLVDRKTLSAQMADSQDMTSPGSYSNYSWYSRLIAGSASRLSRYREFDLMDADVDIARALDIIAEEMSRNSSKGDFCLELDFMDDKNKNASAVSTIRAALNYWSKIHDWETRLFMVARNLVKYGDVIFKKRSFTNRWEYVNMKNVLAAVVNEEDVTEVQAWQVKEDYKKFNNSSGTGNFTTGMSQQAEKTELIYADQVVRFTLNDDMSESAPFGESILRSVYRAFKQKELLEDALIIYRIQRAPERRVFKIDVGKMPPHKIKTYLETIKNEIRQKKVPSFNGGQNEVDAVYNPHSMVEDFFLASRADGRGSTIETLPGGQNLGSLEDLDYFMKKVFRGLRIPDSYMAQGSDNSGGGIFNDGKVGVAYIQELMFASMIERLQGHMEKPLDEEFKEFLRSCSIQFDPTSFRVRLPAPNNFATYRQLELDSALLSSYGSADGIQYMSKRFIMKRFLQLTEEEMLENETMLREEKGIKNNGKADYPLLYGTPGEGGMGGGAGFGGGFGGDIGGGMDMAGAGGMETGEPGAAPAGTEAPPPEAGGAAPSPA